MTKQDFFDLCSSSYLTLPDYPFGEDFETAVLRHSDNRKWYALVMRVSRRKFGFDSDEVIDVVNLKLPLEMFGSFGPADGVYPAYHMNKLHWISALLPDTSDDLIKFLANASYKATKNKKKCRKAYQYFLSQTCRTGAGGDPRVILAVFHHFNIFQSQCLKKRSAV